MLSSSNLGQVLQAFANLQAGGAGFAVDEDEGHGVFRLPCCQLGFSVAAI